ncbi:MAG: hypothetical protein HY360_03975 [Verrucomicrobia bacterium]|nr:hypothetical protein [Verrucomicrobiota bacterium]
MTHCAKANSCPLTHLERINTALGRRRCDRIPFGELVIDNRCAEAVLGRPTPIHNIPLWLDRMSAGDWEELVAQEARDRIDLALELGLDWLSVDQNYSRNYLPVQKTAKNQWNHRGTVMTHDPQTRMMSYSWQTNKTRDVDQYAEEIRRAKPPQGPDESVFEVIRRMQQRLQEMKLDIPMVMRNYTMSVQSHLELLAVHPESALAFFKNMTTLAIFNGEAAIANGVSVVGVGGHVGANRTSMISDEQYRRFILPGIRQQIDVFHAKGAKAYIATGGCIWPIAEAFLIDSDADAYAGIDTYAGMDLARLRDEYGDRLCLIGGTDSVHTLSHGSEQTVREETLEVLELFKDHPGFILASSNSVHDDVPPRNFIAMLTAYRNFFGI